MTAIKYILKSLLKLAALPVILILRITMLLTKIVGTSAPISCLL